MKHITDLEIKFLENISEENSYSNILNNSRLRGWYKFEVSDEMFDHTFCLFRLPPIMNLYGNVLKRFTLEERKAGLHRFLIGKDLREEVDYLMSKFNNDISECVKNLSDDKVEDLLNRLNKIITFDCNRIPYLHVKYYKGDKNLDLDDLVYKHIMGLPDYLNILNKTLSEEIDFNTSEDISKGIIFNEYTQYLNEKRK